MYNSSFYKTHPRYLHAISPEYLYSAIPKWRNPFPGFSAAMQMYVSIRLLQATSYASMLISEYLWKELNRKKNSDTIHLQA